LKDLKFSSFIQVSLVTWLKMAPPEIERIIEDEEMEIDFFRPDRIGCAGVPFWSSGDPAGIQHGRSTFCR
jgi:hypothetical protein